MVFGRIILTAGLLWQGISAGGFSRDAPASPFTQVADMPQLLCRVRPQSQATGQTLLELWPALLLLNWLPIPVEWRLCEATASPGAPHSTCCMGQFGPFCLVSLSLIA